MFYYYNPYNRIGICLYMSFLSGQVPINNLSSLTDTHHNLEHTLSETLQSLKLHSSITEQRSANLQVQQVLSDQLLLRSYFSQQLLANQIKLEMQQEWKEAIQLHEKRVIELRAMLISKEAQINFSEGDLGRQTLPKKENLHIVNNVSAQECSIERYVQQRKKLQVEIQALKHVLGTQSTTTAININHNYNFSGRSNDFVLERVLKLIERQDSRQKQLMQTLNSLKTELQGEEVQRKKLKDKYLRLGQERIEMKDVKKQEEYPGTFLGQWLTNIQPVRQQPKILKGRHQLRSRDRRPRKSKQNCQRL